MKVSRFDPNLARPAHEGTILAMPVLPEGIEAPFSHAWGYLKPGGAMDGHAHPTEEIYFFHRGEGTVVVGSEEHPVRAGDVVEIPPDAYHTVRNPSAGDLLWFALWWDPISK